LNPNPSIENVAYLSTPDVSVDTLRLDQIHPIVSGNKWYKLRYYIDEAIQGKYAQIASFGGPFSNHLVALAYAAKLNGLKSTGYVRSNEGEPFTPTLTEAENYGMKLIHLGRASFQAKKLDLLHNPAADKETYFIDEGGYGVLGARGASTIISQQNDIEKDAENDIENEPLLSEYDCIVCAVGTGTMIAGIINGAAAHQKIIGIPVLKNEETIDKEIEYLLINPSASYTLHHNFHQGGYAKTTESQINFMNNLWLDSKIPTDIVYTGKVFYAVQQLIKVNYFTSNSRVLVIHSGGLQGNRSLAKGILQFTQ
jgi:1-aminocyclopropane-1-carboxylate deaminase